MNLETESKFITYYETVDLAVEAFKKEYANDDSIIDVYSGQLLQDPIKDCIVAKTTRHNPGPSGGCCFYGGYNLFFKYI